MKQHVFSQPKTLNAPTVAQKTDALDRATETLIARQTTESRRARWTIDEVLENMMDQPVRVAAEAFAPTGANGVSPRLIPTKDLILPDNTRTEGFPVFFEGMLLEISRQIGVVHLRLGPPPDLRRSAQGCVCFRGGVAVILRGPAIVRLAVPFHIERLSSSEENYWLDMRLPRAQLLLRFEKEG